MRKNLNNFHVEGYVYDSSKLQKRITKDDSKRPGVEYITGELGIAVDEAGLNVIPIHFTFVTATYSKSGKTNNTFTALNKILEATDKTWLTSGKDGAMKVSVDGNLGLNDFINSNNEQVSASRCEGSFLNIITSLKDEIERNTFQADIVINKVSHVDANPERHIDKDYTTVSGGIFNFRNELLPVEFTVHNTGGMNYFEDLGVTSSEPVYTKIWGRLESKTIKIERTEESAFGEASVTVSERKSREWTITGTAKVPYDFGDESVMTAEDLKKCMQNREVHWADLKKANDEYQASKAAATPVAKTTANTVPAGGFNF